MSKLKRVHYREREYSFTEDRAVFLCGKDVSVNHYRANSTTISDKITCPNCLYAFGILTANETTGDYT